MFNNSNPLVVVYVIFNRTATDLATVNNITEVKELVFMYILFGINLGY